MRGSWKLSSSPGGTDGDSQQEHCLPIQQNHSRWQLTDLKDNISRLESGFEDPTLKDRICTRIGGHVAVFRGSDKHTIYLCLEQGCNYRTHSYSTNLRNHLAEHFGPKPFMCDECEYRSERFDSLRKHYRVHTGERPYGCPVCGYRSKTNSNLHAHIRTKHNLPSGKTEKMPSICAQYDTPATQPSQSSSPVSAESASPSTQNTSSPLDMAMRAIYLQTSPIDYSMSVLLNRSM